MVLWPHTDLQISSFTFFIILLGIEAGYRRWNLAGLHAIVLKIHTTYPISSPYTFLLTFKAVQVQDTATRQIKLEFLLDI